MRKRKPKFDLRKRAFDGKIIKWEQRSLTDLGLLDPEEVAAKAAYDHQVWVITGIYNSRREVFS